MVCGIEAAPLPFLASRLRTVGRLKNYSFRWGRYESVDLGDFDVLFTYLSHAAMPALWEKRALKCGRARKEFAVPGKEPSDVIPANGMKTLLYRWTM